MTVRPLARRRRRSSSAAASGGSPSTPSPSSNKMVAAPRWLRSSLIVFLLIALSFLSTDPTLSVRAEDVDAEEPSPADDDGSEVEVEVEADGITATTTSGGEQPRTIPPSPYLSRDELKLLIEAKRSAVFSASSSSSSSASTLSDPPTAGSASTYPDAPLRNIIDSLNSSSASLRSLIESVDSKSSELVELIERQERLAERTERLMGRVADLNAAQARQLVGRLNATLDDEVRRRAAYDEALASLASSSAVAGEGAAAVEKKGEEEGEEKDYVTKRELERTLSSDKLLTPSEAKLINWINKLAGEEMNEYKTHEIELHKERFERLKRRVARLGGGGSGTDDGGGDEKDADGVDRKKEEGGCATATTAASLVRANLLRHSNDGVGWYDHAALDHGGSIVYGIDPADTWTSDTYDPAGGGVGMGNVWWRRYIPEDWERFLDWLSDEEWEGWKVGVPSYLMSSLGLRGSPTAPPETILTSNTNLGSCWAMSGTSGRITIRLPYPVRVSAVTVDHIPPALGGGRGRSSAPRAFRVVGYPPCWMGADSRGERERAECRRLGFDAAAAVGGRASGGGGVELGRFEYELVEEPKEDQNDEVEGEDEGKEGEGEEEGVGAGVVKGKAKAARRSIQTFRIAAGAEGRRSETTSGGTGGGVDGDDEGVGGPGQCTMPPEDDGTPPSCGDDVPPTAAEVMPSLLSGELLTAEEEMTVVEAVTLIVDDNWGNDDYTCLYRFRVHGDPVTH